MRKGFLVLSLFLFLFLFLVVVEGNIPSSFTPTLDEVAFDSKHPASFEWKQKITTNSLTSKREKQARKTTDEDLPYAFDSWIDGPDCPDYDFETVSAELVASNTLVKNALRSITLNAQGLMQELQLLNLTLGMSLFVVYNDTIIYNKGFGVKDMETKIAPDLDTIYDIGSVTKMFTSALFFKAQAEGHLSLDDDITKFFNNDNPPSWRVRNPYKSTSEEKDGKGGIPLHSFAGQVSGMPRESPCGVYCPEYFDAKLNFQYMNNYYSTLYPPFSRSLYSNLGFTLLGRSTERALGKKYEDAMVSEVLTPLNMTSSGFKFTDDVKNRMATGYTTTSTGPKYCQQVSNYNTVEMNWSAPAGGMYSSPRDLATFLSFLFRDSAGKGDVGGLQSLWEFLSAGDNENDGLSGYGLMGWETAYDLGRYVKTKGGLVDGFATSIAFDPILKLGVGALINFPDGGDMDGMTASMMGSLLPTVASAVKSLQPVFSFSPNYEQFLGSYYGVVVLEKGDHLGEGYLDGSNVILASPVVFWWDEELDYVQDGVTFYAYRFKPTENIRLQSSCLAISEVGGNSVVWFSMQKGVPTVTYPDMHLFMLPQGP